MKRYGDLFDRTFTEQAMFNAYLDARRGKRQKRPCFEFELGLGANLAALRREILSGTYVLQPYRQFMVFEPKPRWIYAPAFRDTVVQHAIYREIYPIFDRTFISSSYACRKGYGTHRASDYIQQALRAYDPYLYTLKLDVRKFFYSIDRDILKGLIERKIKDQRLVEMILRFSQSDTPYGIPIGNLLSQILALIYLNPVDHFVKRNLQVRHYVRYVDDMVLVGLTRPQCLDYRDRISQFLKDQLHLELSRSTIQRIRCGVNFVGYRTWGRHRFIRKYSLYKFRRAVRDGNWKTVASILGHAKYTTSLPYLA